MLRERASGLLLHITSLPGPYGMGDLGAEARAFAADLVAMGQSWWQLLPVNPAGYAGTPYASSSAFAGHDLLVSVDRLIEAGLVTKADAAPLLGLSDNPLDFARVVPAKEALLARAAECFLIDASAADRAGYDAFCKAEADWLDDYALFAVLARTYAWRPWTDWDPELRRREEHTLTSALNAFAKPVALMKIRQYLFQRDWDAFRADVNGMGVKLIGDVPIFVAFDSADVWANQGEFKLDPDGRPEVVAGVPPDYFSATGQRWGNPHFRWDVMEQTGFRWWTQRVKRARDLFDMVRIDHFLGFAAAYEIPVDCPTAQQGEWVEGRGRALFTHLKNQFPDLPLIAEDLGVVTDAVIALRDDFNLPGMKILQFEMDQANAAKPESYPANSVSYTGTHDNNTIRGWFNHDIDTTTREIVLANIGGNGADVHWRLIEATFRAASNLAVVPMQDLAGLDVAHRMNLPGTAEGNWGWRMPPGMLTDEIKTHLLSITRDTGRSA